MHDAFATHEVFNQSPPFEDVNLFTTDQALVEAVAREGGGHAAKRLTAFGAVCGSADALQRGRLANENPPRLKPFDGKGRRLDVVEFHPAYHECMEISMHEGLHCSAWDHLAKAGRPAGAGGERRPLGRHLHGDPDGGRPPVPHHHDQRGGARPAAGAGAGQGWLPKILARDYDKSFAPARCQARRHHRHGHDGEAGRHRRARQYHRAQSRPATAGPAPST